MKIFLFQNKETRLNTLRSVFHEGGEQLGSKIAGIQVLLDVVSFNRDTLYPQARHFQVCLWGLHRETRCSLFLSV